MNPNTEETALAGIDGKLTEYGDPGFSRFLRRAFLASAGYDSVDLDRPLVAIADTSSDYTTCHRQMPELVAAVSRGVLEAGGLPIRFSTMSLPEILMSPTSMLYRNLLAMETEEQIRSQPMDAVVLCGGCDKTVPAQLMAAVSADVPAVQLVVGPMVTGYWQGERLGACTDCRRMWAAHRGSELDEAEIAEVQGNLCPTAGTCMVMGTASTMACLTEALGLMVPGGASASAATGRRLQIGAESGRLAVELATTDRRPSAILDWRSFHVAGTAGTIRSATEPIGPPGSIRIVRGSLAPDGAVIKAAAASPALLRHTGPALVFESVDDASVRLDDPDLDIPADTVIVLRNAGPKGAGMPEAASLPIPRKLVSAGVRDMVRVSDARMSGTAYGTVVLHVSPEAAAGGPLALVRDGDLIALDVDAGTLDLLVDQAEFDRRRATWSPPALPERGWRRLYAEQ